MTVGRRARPALGASTDQRCTSWAGANEWRNTTVFAAMLSRGGAGTGAGAGGGVWGRCWQGRVRAACVARVAARLLTRQGRLAGKL